MKRVISVFVVLMLAATIIVGCAQQEAAPAPDAEALASENGDTPRYGEPGWAELGDIVIGNIQDLSGGTMVWGTSYMWGAEWAAEEINAAGGVGGRNVRIVTYDLEGADVTLGITAYNRLKDVDGAVAAMVMASNVGVALAPLSDEVRLPMVHSAMDERATTNPDTGEPYQFMFLTQLSSPQQGTIMGMFAMEHLGVTRAGVLYDNSNTYATTHIHGGDGGFIEWWEANGGEIVAVENFDGTTDLDYRALLGVIQAAEPEVLFISSFVQQNMLAYRQAREMGMDIPIIGNNSFFIPFAELAEGMATQVFLPSNMNFDLPEVREIVDRVIEIEGSEPSNHFFFGQDNVNIIVEAIRRAGTTEPEALAAAIRETTNFEGWTGTLTLNPDTHRPRRLEKWITQVEGFEYIPVMSFAMGD